MKIQKYFKVGDRKYSLYITTFYEAKPYKIFLSVKSINLIDSIVVIYFWYDHDCSTLKIFTGLFANPVIQYKRLSVMDAKIKILKYLTNS